MSVYLDGIAVAGGMAEIKEGTQNVKGLQRQKRTELERQKRKRNCGLN